MQGRAITIIVVVIIVVIIVAALTLVFILKGTTRQLVQRRRRHSRSHYTPSLVSIWRAWGLFLDGFTFHWLLLGLSFPFG
jgi:hypothetical protein